MTPSTSAESFVMSYFTATSEALHLAASDDGVTWTPLNDGEPVLRGEVGAGCIRDPYISRGRDGRFHLLATNGWNSTSIVHAASDDLVEWSPQTLVPVMNGIPFAQNAWAPEFFVDAGTGLHHAVWSSSIHPDASTWRAAARNSTMDHRIWTASTADFVTWSEASIFFDPGYTVIDASVIADGDHYLMAYKDERGDNQGRRNLKGIRTVTFERPGGPFSAESELLTRQPAEGPTLFRTPGSLHLLFDLFLDGSYAALSSPDSRRWSTVDGFQGPPGARHGAVLTVTPNELLRLKRAKTSRAGEAPPLAAASE